MRRYAITPGRVALAVVLAASGLTLAETPAAAQDVTVDLCVEPGSLPLPGGITSAIWGYARAALDADNQPTCAGVSAQLPGPVLEAAAGDTVTVVVHNDLAEETAFEVPGIAIVQGGVTTPAHGTASYSFTAAAPGTYLYQSPANAGRQLAMGLYGALVIRPATAGQAYDGATTAFDHEAVLVLSAVDPDFNGNPDAADLYAYHATFWLINGLAYPQTPPIHGEGAGHRVLLRYLNAGYDNTTMMLLGTHERVIARDARPLANPFDASAETIPAGATEDVIVTIPPAGTSFALFNRQLHLTNGAVGNSAHTPGGMLTFLQVP
jgi:FtsP/CotA-like multicopper oxidase with cupredoxin domain